MKKLLYSECIFLMAAASATWLKCAGPQVSPSQRTAYHHVYVGSSVLGRPQFQRLYKSARKFEDWKRPFLLSNISLATLL